MKINIQYLFVFGVRPPYQLSPAHNHCRLNIDGPPLVIQSWQCQNVLVLSKSYFKQWPPLTMATFKGSKKLQNSTKHAKWHKPIPATLRNYSGYAKTLFFKAIPVPCGWPEISNFWWNIDSCHREYRHVPFPTRPNHRDQGNSQLYIWKEHTIRLGIYFGKIFFNIARICSLEISNAFIMIMRNRNLISLAMTSFAKEFEIPNF